MITKKQSIGFLEYQFPPWQMWTLLIGIDLVVISGTIVQVVSGKAFGNKPMSDPGLIIICIIMLILTVCLLTSKLITGINDEGISVRYFPFLLKEKFYIWDEIEEAHIKKYNAFTDYGGWGIRYGGWGIGRFGNRYGKWRILPSVNKKAYILSGKYGLELLLKNGKEILIGTRMPEEIEKIIQKKYSSKAFSK